MKALRPDHQSLLDACLRFVRQAAESGQARYVLAHATIADATGTPPARVDPNEAVTFAGHLAEPLRHLSAHLDARRESLGQEHERVLGIDSAFEHFLADAYGPNGVATAQTLRLGATLRWRSYRLKSTNREAAGLLTSRWCTLAGPPLRALANHEWARSRDTVRAAPGSPEAEQLMPTPSLSLDVLEAMFTSYWAVPRDRSVTNTVTFHALIRWLLGEGTTVEPAPSLTIAGGLDELSRRLQLHSRTTRSELENSLKAMRETPLTVPGSEPFTLLSMLEHPWPRSAFRLTLAPSLRLTQHQSTARRIAIPSLPPFAGGQRLHPAQAALELLVTTELPLPAGHHLTDYHPVIPIETWERWMTRVGLPVTLLPALLKLWSPAGDASP